ncbi:MAG: hypothetical protein ABI787_02625, partial [Spartobacteria bacterium]
MILAIGKPRRFALRNEKHMSGKNWVLVALAVSLIWRGTAAHAQDNGALLELLVKKGLITDQEAQAVRADLVKESKATSAGKLKLSTPVTELELY